MKNLFVAATLVCLAAGAAIAQKSFYSKEFKVGFKYPVASRLTTKADDLVVMTDSLKGIAKVTLTRPGPGLYDADATVSAGAMTEKACKALSANDEPKRTKFGTVTFDKTSYVEGGMESVQPQEFYRTYHDGNCYEVRLSVGMPKRPKRGVSDRTAFEQMYAVLRSLYFGK